MAQGAKAEAYPHGYVRIGQQSMRHKALPPRGLRPIWPVAVLLLSPPDASGPRRCFLRRALPQAKFDSTNGQLFVSIPRAKRLEGGMTFDAASEKRRRDGIRKSLEISRLQMCHLKDTKPGGAGFVSARVIQE